MWSKSSQYCVANQFFPFVNFFFLSRTVMNYLLICFPSQIVSKVEQRISHSVFFMQTIKFRLMYRVCVVIFINLSFKFQISKKNNIFMIPCSNVILLLLIFFLLFVNWSHKSQNPTPCMQMDEKRECTSQPNRYVPNSLTS